MEYVNFRVHVEYLNMGTIRGALVLSTGEEWAIRNSAGIWRVDACVGLTPGSYVEGYPVGREVVGSSLHLTKPATIEEAADFLYYSPLYPAINLWEARKIARTLGPDAAEQLRRNPWLIEGLVSKPMQVVAAWAALGTVHIC